VSQGDVMQIFRDAITLIIEISAPILLTGLIIGLTVSIFQAMTQINEQTMTFIPKIVGILLALLIFGNWMLTRLVEYTEQLFGSIVTYIQ
jgi:flagellar biosynthetic protein FliQ